MQVAIFEMLPEGELFATLEFNSHLFLLALTKPHRLMKIFTAFLGALLIAFIQTTHGEHGEHGDEHNLETVHGDDHH